MNDRKVIFGNVAEEKDTQTLVAYQASDGERVMWIPHAVIECRIRMNSGDTAYVLNANNMTTGSFPLAQAFAGERSPLPPTLPQHIEVQDLVEQGAAEANIRAALKASAPTPATTTPTPAPVVETTGQALFGIGTPAPAPAPAPAPQTVEELLEAEAEVDDSTPVFNPTESQVVAKKVDPDAPDLSGTAWDGALLNGGRHEASVPWDFEAKKIPLLAPDDDGNIHRLTNKGGNQAHYALVNPTLKDNNRPLGAILAPCISDNYAVVNHGQIFKPIMKHAEGTGLKALVTSYNEGKRARLDLDVSAAAQTRKAAAERLSEQGHAYLNLDAFSAQANNLHGLYKMGLTINNSLDGKGSLHIDLMSQRVYCQNLAMMGGSQNLVKMRHMKGVMGGIDWDQWGSNMVDALVEVEKWMHTTELFKHIPVDVQLFEQLLTVADNFDLINAPKVMWPEKGKDPKITGGYLWRAISNGYARPESEYVKVHKEDEGTLFHALNAFTGTYTHRPVWKSLDNKTTLTGSVGSLDSLSNRLKKTSKVFNAIGESAISGYMNSAGIDNGELTPGDLQDMKRFLGEDEGVMEIKIGGNSLAAMPTYSDVLGLTVLDEMGGPNGL
jgi:hypothetical protein